MVSVVDLVPELRPGYVDPSALESAIDVALAGPIAPLPEAHREYYRRVYALAAAHHHAWADSLAESPRAGAALLRLMSGEAAPADLAIVDAVVDATHTASMRTGSRIAAARPRLYDGLVEHRSATGRTHYGVTDSGFAWVSIRRPDGFVLHAEVSPEGDLAKLDVFAPFLKRHLEALTFALWAIDRSTDWRTALAVEMGRQLADAADD